MPKAHNVSGISSKKKVVMMRDMRERVSSHSGAPGPSAGVQESERTVYPRSMMMQMASMAVYGPLNSVMFDVILVYVPKR